MFSIKLKELREMHGYKSQLAFAKAFGVAQSTVAGWENKSREPNYETTIRLANFFHVSIDDLISDNSFWSTPFFSALRQYASVIALSRDLDLFPKIVKYYEDHPEYMEMKVKGKGISLKERMELEEILGLEIQVAIALGCSLCKTPEEYSELYMEYLYSEKSIAEIVSAYRGVNEEGQKYIVKQAEFAAAQPEYRAAPLPFRQVGRLIYVDFRRKK